MQVVTLTTDFGTRDYYSATLKGAILNKSKNIQIVDISHNISSYDIVEGAFFINNAYHHFPEGTIHIACVNDYSQEGQKFIIFEKNKHIFIGPDNGLYSLIFHDEPPFPVYEIDFDQHGASMHLLLGHAVAYLSHKLPLNEIGPKKDGFQKKLGLQPVKTKNQIRATIIHIDNFGNVIVNLKKELFDKVRNGRTFNLYYKSKDPIDQISTFYQDVSVGDVLCMFNSADFLEIAVNMGNAHTLLHLNKHETIQIDFI